MAGSQSTGVFRQHLKEMLTCTFNKNNCLEIPSNLNYCDCPVQIYGLHADGPSIFLVLLKGMRKVVLSGIFSMTGLSPPTTHTHTHTPVLWNSPQLRVFSFWPIFHTETYPENELLFGSLCISLSAAAAKSLQSYPTLCDPIDGSPPGSPSLGFSRQEH